MHSSVSPWPFRRVVSRLSEGSSTAVQSGIFFFRKWKFDAHRSEQLANNRTSLSLLSCVLTGFGRDARGPSFSCSFFYFFPLARYDSNLHSRYLYEMFSRSLRGTGRLTSCTLRLKPTRSANLTARAMVRSPCSSGMVVQSTTPMLGPLVPRRTTDQALVRHCVRLFVLLL